jgi:hypothetical protein
MDKITEAIHTLNILDNCMEVCIDQLCRAGESDRTDRRFVGSVKAWINKKKNKLENKMAIEQSCGTLL